MPPRAPGPIAFHEYLEKVNLEDRADLSESALRASRERGPPEGAQRRPSAPRSGDRGWAKIGEAPPPGELLRRVVDVAYQITVRLPRGVTVDALA